MQHALPFLEAILPANGLRVVAFRPPRWKNGFKHVFLETDEQLIEESKRLDDAGIQSWFALAVYNDPEEGRKASNTTHLQCLWIDVDYKNYDSPEQANDDVARLIEHIGPPTARVQSGGGMHVYWALRSALPTDQWKPLADAFQATWQSLGIKADAVSADAARVLRLPGTHNRKAEYGQAREVVLESLDDISYDATTLAKKLNAASPKNSIPVIGEIPKEMLGGMDDLGANLGHRPSFVKPLIEKCRQIKYAYTNQGEVDANTWYAVVGLARHLEDGRRAAHLLSHRHPGYSVQETDDKIAQHEKSGIGPTTCAHFKRINPTHCQGCTYNITSPIQLGYPEVEAVEPVVTVVERTVTDEGDVVVVERKAHPDVDMPEGYVYDGTTMYRKVKDEDTGMWRDEEVFNGFLCPERMVSNHRNGFVTDIQLYVQSQTQTPRRIVVPAKALADKRDLCRELSGKGVIYLNKNAGHILDMLQRMVMSAQAKRDDAVSADQMGWQENGMFVVGSTGYQRSGSPMFDLPVPNSTKAVARNYEPAGSLEAWKRTANLYNHEGAEPYQFTLLYGAAGILLPETKHSGVVLSLYSQNAGRGKSTAGYGALSWWGDPSGIKSQSKDTNNALFSKASRHKNLPLLLDEVTDKPSWELEDLVYFLSQGREKERLTADSTPKPPLPGWALPVISTSNNSIKSKLQTKRGDTQGLFARILEIQMDLDFATSRTYTEKRALATGFVENYGHAGPKLLEMVWKNWDTYVSMLDKVMARLDHAVSGDPAFRFWVSSCAATLVVGVAAKQAGLVEYDISKLTKWTVELLRSQLSDTNTALATSDDVLAQFLEVNANRIVVSYDRHLGTGNSVPAVWPDNGVHGNQLVGRAELPKRTLYISMSAFMRFCHETGFDLSAFVHNAVANTLNGETLLRSKAPVYVSLGHGTKTASARTKCLAFNMLHPALRDYARGVDSQITEANHLRSIK